VGSAGPAVSPFDLDRSHPLKGSTAASRRLRTSKSRRLDRQSLAVSTDDIDGNFNSRDLGRLTNSRLGSVGGQAGGNKRDQRGIAKRFRIGHPASQTRSSLYPFAWQPPVSQGFRRARAGGAPRTLPWGSDPRRSRQKSLERPRPSSVRPFFSSKSARLYRAPYCRGSSSSAFVHDRLRRLLLQSAWADPDRQAS